MSNGLSIIFTCLYDLFDIVFMKHNVVYVFVILVDDVYCVAIHDLSPVLTTLFSIELGGFNTLIGPAVEYSCSVWHPHKKSNKDKIEQVQCKEARFVSNNFRRKASV